MTQPTFTGIGCYAKPERLGRIFKKLMQDYALGPIKGNQLFDGLLSDEIKGVDLLQELIADQRPDICSGDCDDTNSKAFSKITGFYVTLNDQGLNLSIFTRSKSCQPEIITTRLEGLTKLRQKRLH